MKKADGFVVGTALGAVGASLVATFGILCCAGPAVVAVLGAGGALAAARLEPYRPYLLAGSAAMLAFGFWRSYRPAAGGDACPTRTGRLTRAVLWIAAALFGLALVLPEILS